MSYFDSSEVAHGYARSRPYFHPEVIRRIKSNLGLKHKLKQALDVGCGAGLSTIALTEIAEKVIGVDASESMTRSATHHDTVEYYNYAAENLPFDIKFDLITLSGSINWVDRPRFFSEAKRILQPGGSVIVYDNTILGIMKEDDRFSTWYEKDYLTRCPKPPRDESPMTPQEAAEYGFEFKTSETYTNETSFTFEAFIDYILTQSNVTVALKTDSEDENDLKQWIRSSLLPFFEDKQRTLRFGGYIWYLCLL